MEELPEIIAELTDYLNFLLSFFHSEYQLANFRRLVLSNQMDKIWTKSISKNSDGWHRQSQLRG